MVRLLLLRHAKSSIGDATIRDFDRPLYFRGRSAAPLMGRHMADHQLLPDKILCSGARRTRETLAGLLPFVASDVEIRVLRQLYEAGSGAYMEALRAQAGTARSVMVIGHNPTIQAFATDLVGRGNPALMEQIREKYPTAGLAVIDFDGGWNDVTSGKGRIVAFFRPRELEVVGAEDAGDPDE